MLSVDARVLFQITQHAVETYSTAVIAEMDYFMATAIDFHAAFVKNVCRQQNLCG